MSLDTIIAQLEGVKKRGHGYIARCPAHADRSPSLSLREGDDERVLIHCHAGCSPEAVMSAIGMTMNDLFPEGQRRQPIAPGVTRTDLREAVEIERGIAFIVAADRRAGKPIKPADKARADLARQRIGMAGRYGC